MDPRQPGRYQGPGNTDEHVLRLDFAGPQTTSPVMEGVKATVLIVGDVGSWVIGTQSAATEALQFTMGVSTTGRC